MIIKEEEIGKDFTAKAAPAADTGAKANGEDTTPPPAIIPAHATRGGGFMAAYNPIYYTLDGILPSGFLYGVTARRSGDKTARLIMASCAVIKGSERIMGCDVTAGRVAYVIKENPIDFGMKLAVNFHFHGISHETANEKLLVLDCRADSPEQIAEKLTQDAGEHGDFKLICYDTFSREACEEWLRDSLGRRVAKPK